MATTTRIDVDTVLCQMSAQALGSGNPRADLNLLLSGIKSKMSVSSGAAPIEVRKFNESLQHLADELCNLYDQTKSLLYNVSDIWEAAESEISRNLTK